MIIYTPNPTFMPSLSKIGDLSCTTSCLVLPGFLMDTLLTIIPRARMSSELIAHEAEGRMGYWLNAHEGERNNWF